MLSRAKYAENVYDSLPVNINNKALSILMAETVEVLPHIYTISYCTASAV